MQLELSPLTDREVYARSKAWAGALAEQCLDGHHDPDHPKHLVFLILLEDYAVLSRADQQRLG